MKLKDTQKQMENARIEVEKPFPKEMELAEKMERLNELNALLNMEQGGGAQEQQENEAIVPGKSKIRQSIGDKLAGYQGQLEDDRSGDVDEERKNVACL